jgi:AAA15 family ATPase/GTPase
MIYYHFTKKFKKHSSSALQKEIARIFRSYSSADTIEGIKRFSSFTSGMFIMNLKKPNLGGKIKIILEQQKKKIEEKDVTVYFVRALHKNLQDYVEIKEGKWLNYNPLPEIDSFDFEQRIKDKISPKNEAKPFPPNEMTAWHDEYKLQVSYDIYESEEWVKFAMSNSPQEGMPDGEVALYQMAIRDFIDFKDSVLVTEVNGQKELLIVEYESIKILLSRVYVESVPSTLYLLHLGGKKGQESIWEEKYNKLLSDGNFPTTLQDVSSVGFKAYPKWVVKNLELWTKIEKNNELGNLSLLPEQTEALRNFQFPKYINGQAGSGKSTFLYYLFANAYYYKYADVIKGDVIFLTENKRLLEHTIQNTYDLLLFNPEFELDFDDIALENLRTHFHSFRDFLLNLLPENQTKFQKDKYLDFPKFKNKYLESNLPDWTKKRYSPEYVWFTISTYVYGYYQDEAITSKNYDEKMPTTYSKRLIPKDLLKGMESDVISKFYDKLIEEEGYWDKVKLIKYINENVELTEKYELIFCDEAQDFSRVELEFILNLSSYSEYNLEDVKQFPVVFAGDALQTVKPTGFKTEVLTAMLHNALEETGFNFDSKDLEIKPVYNYRSSQAIVNLANAIQYRRKKDFEADIERPQMSKRPTLAEYENINVFINFQEVNEEIKKKIKHKTVIVPVNSIEIDSYIKQYEILEEVNSVVSAVDAKGLDFAQVVVWGFGDYLLQNQTDMKEYEKIFFYNKLYVAVTRARSELIIIDSKNAKEAFWDKVLTEYIGSGWSDSNKCDDIDDILISDTNGIVQSTSQDLEEDIDKQMEQGIINSNISLLKLAAQHYYKIPGKQGKYYLCNGAIEEIKENWPEAANFYKKKQVGKEGLEKAANAYWKGKVWHELTSMNTLMGKDQKMRIVVATILDDEADLSEKDLEFLQSNVSSLRKELKKVDWKDDFVDKLYKLLVLSESDVANDAIVSVLEKICPAENEDILKYIGKYYFETKAYKEAIDVFERINDNDSKLFLLSNLRLSERKKDFSSQIVWLGRLAIDVGENRIELANEIASIFSERFGGDIENVDSESLYTNLYVYFSLLTTSNTPKLLLIAQKVEKIFEVRQRQLSENYFRLLQNGLFNKSTINFILERWSKNLYEAGERVEKINKLYQNLSIENEDIPFKKFTERELQEISKTPQYINKPTSGTIRNIRIKNFKRFENVEVSDLGLFNIIVGDNNVGKTSFLEALSFTPNPQELTVRLAFSHIERKRVILKSDLTSVTNPILYYDLSDEKNFVENFKNDNLKHENIVFELAEGRTIQRFEICDGQNINCIQINEKYLQKVLYSDSAKVPIIFYGKGYDSDLIDTYSEYITADPEMEDDFIDNLKSTFIPNLERIRIIGEEIKIYENNKITGLKKSIPLHQYGEGVKKLFRVLVMLEIHKGKILLIDEVDAGIHYSKFKEFWKMVITIAMRNNTQVIATTHNEECMEYFADVISELGNEYESEARIVQMKNVGENLKIRSYNYESFNRSLENDLELRGGDLL